jgi:hypothetical protein
MKNYHSFLVFLLVILTGRLFAQKEVQISAPQLELSGNLISISYEILNSSRNDLYTIWIEVTDTAGNSIEAKSLSGDCGENVKGGGKKKIKWDLAADSTYLDAGIYVQVYGERKVPLVAEPLVGEETRPESKQTNYINPYIALGQSALYPGWGLSKCTGKKIYLINGILGYGCIATAIIFNQVGISTYDNYLTTGDMTQVDGLYEKAVLQDNISEASAYTAIGVWAASLVWTYVVVARTNNGRKEKQADLLRIQPICDPGYQSLMLGFRYTF